MKRVIIIISFIFICKNFAQEVRLGFRAEIFGPLYEKTGFGKTFYLNPIPPNLYFVSAIKASHNLQIDFRPGLSFIENYGGFEFGGYLKYFPSESIYFLVAYNVHLMEGDAHGFHSNNATTFSMPGLGVGIITGKYSSLEFMVFIPSPKEWTHDIVFKTSGYKEINSSFDVIFKIGFGFDWPI
jgi:hypothetical protein